VSKAPHGWARATIARHSKSFALASRLLPPAVAADAVVLYAWCRRADDAIDLVPPAAQPARLRALRSEIDAVYAGRALDDPHLEAFRDVVGRRRVPRVYVDELLAGMAMDAQGIEYATWSDLAQYCYRVAGTVGLMMCHVMGVDADDALVHAAHLGMAMQLTNIARDVGEDWRRGRLYLPDAALAAHGAPGLRARLGTPLPRAAAGAVALTTEAALDQADAYYRSGDAGMRHLSRRCALAVRTARLVYARIGDEVRARGCDPFAGRAVVSRSRKLGSLARAAFAAIASPAPRWRLQPRIPTGCLDDPARVLSPPLSADGAYAA
jgi:phytoene synthase